MCIQCNWNKIWLFLRYVHIEHPHSHHRIYIWLISRTLIQLYAIKNLSKFYDSGSVRINLVYACFAHVYLHNMSSTKWWILRYVFLDFSLCLHVSYMDYTLDILSGACIRMFILQNCVLRFISIQYNVFRCLKNPFKK